MFCGGEVRCEGCVLNSANFSFLSSQDLTGRFLDSLFKGKNSVVGYPSVFVLKCLNMEVKTYLEKYSMSFQNLLLIFLLMNGAWKTIMMGQIIQERISKASDMKYARDPVSEKGKYNTIGMIV